MLDWASWLSVCSQDKLFPQAIDYLQRAFSVRRRVGPVLLSRYVSRLSDCADRLPPPEKTPCVKYNLYKPKEKLFVLSDNVQPTSIWGREMTLIATARTPAQMWPGVAPSLCHSTTCRSGRATANRYCRNEARSILWTTSCSMYLILSPPVVPDKQSVSILSHVWANG